MNRLKIVVVCGATLLMTAAVAVVVASRNRQPIATRRGMTPCAQ